MSLWASFIWATQPFVSPAFIAVLEASKCVCADFFFGGIRYRGHLAVHHLHVGVGAPVFIVLGRRGHKHRRGDDGR